VKAGANKFWQKHCGLVWSNHDANDATHIRVALLRPRFSLLLEIALEFGLERVHREWLELQKDGTREVLRAREPVERILSNIEKGFSLATARN
jgi:hypothetical protein